MKLAPQVSPDSVREPDFEMLSVDRDVEDSDQVQFNKMSDFLQEAFFVSKVTIRKFIYVFHSSKV